MSRNLVFTLSVLSSLVLGQAVIALAVDSCQPVFDGMTKIVTTPSHSYTTRTAGSADSAQPALSETIYVDGKVYMRVSDKWMQRPATPQEALEELKDNRDRGKYTCQILRSGLIGVEPVTIYSVHSDTENFKEDSQMWISKATGRVLKEEQDVDMGGKTGKEHRSARFEYNNVHAPM